MTFNNKILSLDLSTTSTGWAFVDLCLRGSLTYGAIKPKPHKDKSYPWQQLAKIDEIVEQIIAIITAYLPDIIVIEEINRGISRLTQKTLDGLHYILLDHLNHTGYEKGKVIFIDSDGATGWRSANGLKLQLSDQDKVDNKAINRYNRKLKKGQRGRKLKITKKTLACRYVNQKYGLKLIENKASGNDIADAIGLLTFYVEIHTKSGEVS